MIVVVEVEKWPGTRRAIHLRLLYGPYSMTTPGVTRERLFGWARQSAKDELGKIGVKDFVVVRVGELENWEYEEVRDER